MRCQYQDFASQLDIPLRTLNNRLLAVESSPLIRFFPGDYWVFNPLDHIFLLVVLDYHDWKILTAHSLIHSHKFNADTKQCERGAQILPILEVSRGTRFRRSPVANLADVTDITMDSRN
jgi:hypothetical protein